MKYFIGFVVGVLFVEASFFLAGWARREYGDSWTVTGLLVASNIVAGGLLIWLLSLL